MGRGVVVVLDIRLPLAGPDVDEWAAQRPLVDRLLVKEDAALN